MPADLPHWRTVCDAADGWLKSGATVKMDDELRRQCRIAAGRKPGPTAAVAGSQPVKAAEEVSRASRGYDAGKKINGRNRHIAVDTIGLLLTVLITAASVQDRDGARPLLWSLRRAFPSVKPGPGRRPIRWQARHPGQVPAQPEAGSGNRQAAR
jgi:putative transposase